MFYLTESRDKGEKKAVILLMIYLSLYPIILSLFQDREDFSKGKRPGKSIS